MPVNFSKNLKRKLVFVPVWTISVLLIVMLQISSNSSTVNMIQTIRCCVFIGERIAIFRHSIRFLFSENDSGPLPRSPPSQSPHDDVVEEKSHRANSRSTRTRRLRSSKDAVSAAAPSADAPGSPAETGAGPGNGERVDNSSTLDVPVTAPRRRRRIRKSSEKTSASNSTPTTPDREGVSSKFADEKPTTPSSPRTPDKVVAQDLKSPKGGSPKPTAIVPEMSAEKKQDNVRVTPVAVESSRDATKAKAIRGVTTRSSENNGATMTSERTLTESKPVNSTKKKQPGNAATRNLPPAPGGRMFENV